MDELYEALRTAEAEGRTADVKRLIEYINQIPAEEKQPSNVALPAELAMLGGAGATAKQVGEYGLKGTRNVVAKVEQIIEGMKKLEDLKNAPVEEVAKTKLTPTQKYAIKMHGGIYTPLQDMSKAYSAGEEATAFKAANPAWEVRQGSSIALPPDLKASATAAKTQVAAPSVLNRVQQAVEPITSSLKSIGAPLKFIGKFVTPIAGGFEAGMQGGEAINRAEVGDVPGTVISGLGALGSAAMMSGNPLFAVPGAAASITAPQINKYLDLLRQGRIVHGAPAYEQTTPMGENYANGGLVYLAGGGAISTEEAQRQIKEWLEKNKPVPERTYTERLRDMGRDPSIPGSPIVKNTPPSKGVSGGAGYVPGTMNPFNPDSPLNR